MMPTRATNLLLSVLLLALFSCASPRVNPLLSQDPDVSLTQVEFNQQAKMTQSLWNERQKKSSLEKFLKLEEQLCRSRFQTKELLTTLARAHNFYAEYHTSDWSEKTEHWEMGANWAEKALHLNRQGTIPPDEYLSELNASDAPSLYWYAVNLGRWTSRQGVSTILKYKNRIKKMIDRVEVLQPNYLYGAVQRYNGVYYALLPGYTEEDLKKSRIYFEKAVHQHPDYFANRVMFAEYYAAKMDEKKIYTQQLQAVLHGNAQKLKDVYPEQILEQAKAKKLLEKHL